MRSLLPLFAGLAGGLIAVPAMAITGNAAQGLEDMRELNLIVLGTLTTNGQEVEGRTFAGTLAGSNNTNFGIGRSSQGSAPSSFGVLTVVNDATGSFRLKAGYQNGANGIVGTAALIGGSADAFDFNDNGGYVGSISVGKNLNGPGNINNNSVTYGGSVANGINGAIHDATIAAGGTNDLKAALAAEQTAMSNDLTALSTDLGAIVPLSTITSTSSALNYSGATNGIAVYTMTASAFQDQNANFDNLFANTPAGDVTIINVQGTSLTEAGNVNSTALNQSVIWNFYQATGSVSLKGFHGSVLAPFAAVSNSSALEGSIVASSFTLNGEVHMGTFAGGSSNPTTFAHALGLGAPAGGVPEPASWATMVLGFGVVGGAVRRRTQARAAA